MQCSHSLHLSSCFVKNVKSNGKWAVLKQHLSSVSNHFLKNFITQVSVHKHIHTLVTEATKCKVPLPQGYSGM